MQGTFFPSPHHPAVVMHLHAFCLPMVRDNQPRSSKHRITINLSWMPISVATLQLEYKLSRGNALYCPSINALELGAMVHTSVHAP